MGWKGLLRSINASMNRAAREKERNNKRSLRKYIANQKQYNNQQSLLAAKQQVIAFENYIKSLCGLHTETSSQYINWQDIAKQPSPSQPIKSDAHENVARDKYRRYKPNIFYNFFHLES